MLWFIKLFETDGVESGFILFFLTFSVITFHRPPKISRSIEIKNGSKIFKKSLKEFKFNSEFGFEFKIKSILESIFDKVSKRTSTILYAARTRPPWNFDHLNSILIFSSCDDTTERLSKEATVTAVPHPKNVDKNDVYPAQKFSSANRSHAKYADFE